MTHEPAPDTTIGLIFGGQSAEHEVSLQSAKNVLAAIDRDRFTVFPIGIDSNGRWWTFTNEDCFINADDPATIALNPETRAPFPLSRLEPGARGERPFDVAFPLLHGPYGEDGTIQGLFRLLGIPCVGGSVLGSAVGMDKDVMKRLLRDAGIPIGKFLTVTDPREVDIETVTADLGLPCFVKPANLGSSVGVSKVADAEELSDAVELAFTHDQKVLIEEAIDGRELECGVLGNHEPRASAIGEVIPAHDFYSYEAKYLDEQGAGLVIPAELDAADIARVQELAIDTFRALEGRGLARVDGFLRENGELLVNEINTMPGFTKISMYPRLFAEVGVSYPELITELIELAKK